MSTDLTNYEEVTNMLVQHTFLTPEFLMNKMIEGRRVEIGTELSKISDSIIKEAQNERWKKLKRDLIRNEYCSLYKIIVEMSLCTCQDCINYTKKLEAKALAKASFIPRRSPRLAHKPRVKYTEPESESDSDSDFIIKPLPIQEVKEDDTFKVEYDRSKLVFVPLTKEDLGLNGGWTGISFLQYTGNEKAIKMLNWLMECLENQAFEDDQMCSDYSSYSLDMNDKAPYDKIKNLPGVSYGKTGYEIIFGEMDIEPILRVLRMKSKKCYGLYDRDPKVREYRDLVDDIGQLFTDRTTCEYAVKYMGSLDMLKKAHENGRKWDAKTCKLAGEMGRLDCLKYLHENGCPWDAYTAISAASNGHLDCLKYAHENGCSMIDILGKSVFTAAASNGRLDCLKYCHDNKIYWNRYVCNYAALNGQLECLKYAHENGCPWDKWTCVNAAKSGQLDCLKYAHENGCTWDEETCNSAVTGNHLNCLQYAHENGCPWNKKTYEIATERFYNRESCKKYLIENGCPR